MLWKTTLQLKAVPEVITPDVNTLVRIFGFESIIILRKKFFILGGETFVVHERPESTVDAAEGGGATVSCPHPGAD